MVINIIMHIKEKFVV